MCGSKHSANWTTSRPSLPRSYSLLSNVLARFPHYSRPIKKEKLDDVGVIGLWFSVCVCVCVCVCVVACDHMLYLCACMCSGVQSSNISSSLSLHPLSGSFVFEQNKNVFLAEMPRHEGTSEECSQHALQHVQVRGSGWGYSLLSSSVLARISQPHIIGYNKQAASWHHRPTVGCFICSTFALEYPRWVTSRLLYLNQVHEATSFTITHILQQHFSAIGIPVFYFCHRWVHESTKWQPSRVKMITELLFASIQFSSDLWVWKHDSTSLRDIYYTLPVKQTSESALDSSSSSSWQLV